ncbi:hypothetical protein SDC9_173688 [bioreactor metagenome]|uniref:Uncharacterized protein n=1 Tax=bioreactor metagenome TaxID=1076179 RepID=A0A645GQM5_9ZZZZ
MGEPAELVVQVGFVDLALHRSTELVVLVTDIVLEGIDLVIEVGVFILLLDRVKKLGCPRLHILGQCLQPVTKIHR